MNAELKKATLQHIVNFENAMNYRVLFFSQGWIELCEKRRKLAEEIRPAFVDELRILQI
jgi:hypothetical protein